MKRYIIKSISKATDENKNFQGQEAIAYYGRAEKMIGYEGTHAEAIHMVQDIHPYMVKEYGYTRLCDAKRNWSYRNPENTKFWRTKVEIIEFDV